MRDIDMLRKYSGILVPGGFGVRGTEGKILAIKFARENNIRIWDYVLACSLQSLSSPGMYWE